MTFCVTNVSVPSGEEKRVCHQLQPWYKHINDTDYWRPTDEAVSRPCNFLLRALLHNYQSYDTYKESPRGPVADSQGLRRPSRMRALLQLFEAISASVIPAALLHRWSAPLARGTAQCFFSAIGCAAFQFTLEDLV